MSVAIEPAIPQARHRPSGLAQLTELAVFRVGELGSVSTAPNVIGSGFVGLNRELIGGGWPRGELTEILCDGVGMGELALLLPAMLNLQAVNSVALANTGRPTGGGGCVWIGAPHLPYALALRDVGIDLARLFIVDSTRTEDSLWAAEQSLASGAMDSVSVWINGAIANTSLRRLKHAAMSGGATCWLMRPTLFARHASPAPLRMMLKGEAGGELTINLIKRRGLPPNKTISLQPRSLPCLARKRLQEQQQRITQNIAQGTASRSTSAATSTQPSTPPSTPLRDWLGRTFGQSALPATPVRSRSMSPDR